MSKLSRVFIAAFLVWGFVPWQSSGEIIPPGRRTIWNPGCCEKHEKY